LCSFVGECKKLNFSIVKTPTNLKMEKNIQMYKEIGFVADAIKHMEDRSVLYMRANVDTVGQRLAAIRGRG
jgi:hypothetical protein